ncbi:MAG: hypothetical protein HOO95_07980 [Gallionella sp.]|nr:hypothetical protein [Gallionella sp.]
MNILNKGILMMLFAALTLIGCSGGGDSTPATTNVTGKFIDATVVGMDYKCGTSTTVSGTTNSTGQYTCPAGQTVAFYVGDILIGSVSSAMAIVTPLDLVGVANGASPTQVTVTNIVRFLMSISSTNPTTGTLTIDPAVVAAAAGKTADFTANIPTGLDTLINAIKPGATVYTNAQATAHVTASINGLFAGNYAGTYSGAVSGTWSVSVDANGAVTGSIDGAAGTVTGNMGTTLSTGSTYGFTGFGNGYAWTGTLNVSTKKFSGTWDDGAGTGTFTGTATTPPTVTAPTITSFTPTTGAVGATVTITGTNLTSVTQVLFTGPSPSTLFEPGVIATKTAASITTTVPATLAAGSYTISVVHSGGEVSAAGALTVTAGGGGAGSGLTFSPAFNGQSTFADKVPVVTHPASSSTSIQYQVQASLQVVGLAYYLDAVTNISQISFSIVNYKSATGDIGVAGLNAGGSFRSCASVATLFAGQSLPSCSSIGLTFDKTAGSVVFLNTPMIPDTSSASFSSPFTVTGTLTFPPF